MKSFHYLLFLISIILLIGTSCKKDKNKHRKQNGDYVYWVDKNGKAEWIKKAKTGKWKPNTGVLKDYYDNGKIKYEEHYLNRKEYGLKRIWDRESNLIVNKYFVGGSEKDSLRIYYPNGALRLAANYDTSNANKENLDNVVIYYPNGKYYAKLNLSAVSDNSQEKTKQFFFYENGNNHLTFYNDSINIYDKNGILVTSQITPTFLQSIWCRSLNEFITKTQSTTSYDSYCKDCTIKFGCISGNCKEGLSTYVNPIEMSFTAYFVDGMPDSNATIESLNDYKYYEGNTLHYIPNGMGIRYFDNATEKGNFKLSVNDGEFITEWFDGDKFVGPIDGDIKIKFGEYYRNYQNSEKLNTKFNKNNGYGEFYYKSGSTYKGNFKNGKKHGYGEINWPSGDSFKGNWTKGNRSGFGEYTSIDGSKYEGNYKYDFYHGEGKYTYANGSTKEGIFRTGSFIKGIHTKEDGTIENVK